MLIGIYFVILVLFMVLIFWTWNNLKNVEEVKNRVIFIIGGIFALFIVTFIIFCISKIGLTYPNKEALGQVRKITIFLFLPLNGFISLPHIASLIVDIRDGNKDEKMLKNRIKILSVIILVAVIFEIIYLKDFQNGIIQMLER
jgi:succinate dehydrogenase hydrophobic anchor subunit